MDRKLTREQFEELTRQRLQLTARLTPESSRGSTGNGKRRSASSPPISWPSSTGTG